MERVEGARVSEAELLAFRGERLDEDPALRVGVLTGAGGSFSAGMDLKALLKGEHASTPERGGFGIMTRPPTMPLLAAIEGYAVAGGAELAHCCDRFVASETSKLGLPEVKRGLVAVGGGLFRLPARIPYQVVMELARTGDLYPAQRFQELGLITRVVPRARCWPRPWSWPSASQSMHRWRSQPPSRS